MFEIGDAIADTLNEIGTITIIDGDAVTVYVQGPTDIGEGAPDTPLIQIYPQVGTVDYITQTDRHTLRGGGRAEEMDWNIDAYARRRSHFAEDMKALLPLIDAITDKLEEQDVKPYFGESAIQSFRWNWTYGIYPMAQGEYVGVRYVLTTRIF
jgi:hypothetical protein